MKLIIKGKIYSKEHFSDILDKRRASTFNLIETTKENIDLIFGCARSDIFGLKHFMFDGMRVIEIKKPKLDLRKVYITIYGDISVGIKSISTFSKLDAERWTKHQWFISQSVFELLVPNA